MKGTLARLGAAILVSALVLGGCVAETADEEEGTVSPAGAVIEVVPKLPAKPGGAAPDNNAGNASVPVPPAPSSSSPCYGGGPPPCDPDPSPWKNARR
jgi:hypothetical protein